MSARQANRLGYPALVLVVSALLVAVSARADAGASPPGSRAEPSASTPAAPASAPAAAHPPADLRSPRQRSTRYSAYALPAGMWAFDFGILGDSGDDLYGRLGAAVGFKHGFQLDANIGHWGAGIFGVSMRWSFFEAEHVALGANLGVVYVHGAWVWILGDLGQDLVEDSDLVSFPVGLTLSVPCTSWLQLDFFAQYQHTELFGTLGDGPSFYADVQIGARQLLLRPSARFFLSDATAFEFTARLPAYTRVPYESDASLNVGKGYGRSRDGYAKVDFSEGWNLEFGVRSRLRSWLFVTTRIHVGRIADHIYGAVVYPSFNLEFRVN